MIQNTSAMDRPVESKHSWARRLLVFGVPLALVLIAAAVLAFSPLHVYYSREARPYAAIMLMASRIPISTVGRIIRLRLIPFARIAVISFSPARAP